MAKGKKRTEKDYIDAVKMMVKDHGYEHFIPTSLIVKDEKYNITSLSKEVVKKMNGIGKRAGFEIDNSFYATIRIYKRDVFVDPPAEAIALVANYLDNMLSKEDSARRYVEVNKILMGIDSSVRFHMIEDIDEPKEEDGIDYDTPMFSAVKCPSCRETIYTTTKPGDEVECRCGKRFNTGKLEKTAYTCPTCKLTKTMMTGENVHVVGCVNCRTEQYLVKDENGKHSI